MNMEKSELPLSIASLAAYLLFPMLNNRLRFSNSPPGKQPGRIPKTTHMHGVGLGLLNGNQKKKTASIGCLHDFIMGCTTFFGRGDWIRTSGPLHPMQFTALKT